MHMSGTRIFRRALRCMPGAVALMVLIVLPALARPAAPDAAMLKPVQEWIAAYNAGTGPLPENIFTRNVVIADEFPPFIWTGIWGNIDGPPQSITS